MKNKLFITKHPYLNYSFRPIVEFFYEGDLTKSYREVTSELYYITSKNVDYYKDNIKPICYGGFLCPYREEYVPKYYERLLFEVYNDKQDFINMVDFDTLKLYICERKREKKRNNWCEQRRVYKRQWRTPKSKKIYNRAYAKRNLRLEVNKYHKIGKRHYRRDGYIYDYMWWDDYDRVSQHNWKKYRKTQYK